MAAVETKTAEEIRAQMRLIRRDLRANVQGLVVNANQLFDWKNYVRSFPWLTLGGAALIGYMLVPRRRYATLAIPKKTQESLESLRQEIQAAVAPPPPPPAPSLAATLLPIVGGMALKVGTSYLTRLAGSWLEQTTRGFADGDSHRMKSPPYTVRFPIPR